MTKPRAVKCLKLLSAEFPTGNFPFPKKSRQCSQGQAGLGTPGPRRKKWFAQWWQTHTQAPQNDRLIYSISQVPGEWDASCLPEGRDSQPKRRWPRPSHPKGSRLPGAKPERHLFPKLLCTLLMSQALGRDHLKPKTGTKSDWVTLLSFDCLVDFGFCLFIFFFSHFFQILGSFFLI